MQRGDVYWAELPAPVGKRPVVLVSRQQAYAIKTRFTVLPLTRTIRGIPSEVRLGPGDGLPKVGVVNADEVVTIPRDMLRAHIVTLPRSRMREVDAALKFALGIEPTQD